MILVNTIKNYFGLKPTDEITEIGRSFMKFNRRSIIFFGDFICISRQIDELTASLIKREVVIYSTYLLVKRH